MTNYRDACATCGGTVPGQRIKTNGKVWWHDYCDPPSAGPLPTRTTPCQQFKRFSLDDPRYYADICANCGQIHEPTRTTPEVEQAREQLVGAILLSGNHAAGIGKRTSTEVTRIVIQAMDELIAAVRADRLPLPHGKRWKGSRLKRIGSTDTG